MRSACGGGWTLRLSCRACGTWWRGMTCSAPPSPRKGSSWCRSSPVEDPLELAMVDLTGEAGERESTVQALGGCRGGASLRSEPRPLAPCLAAAAARRGTRARDHDAPHHHGFAGVRISSSASWGCCTGPMRPGPRVRWRPRCISMRTTPSGSSSGSGVRNPPPCCRTGSSSCVGRKVCWRCRRIGPGRRCNRSPGRNCRWTCPGP